MLIQVNQLRKVISAADGEIEILRNLNFTIDAGEKVAVVGRSGSGKSTLLALLAGFDTPTEGRIEIQGHCISHMSEDARARFRSEWLGFVFQSFQLIPTMTALENVMLPLQIRGDRLEKQKATQALTALGLLDRLQHKPPQLSGGEQQRVAIARAFVTSPQLLLADEPTGNLDANTGAKIIQQLFDLNQQHDTTLILVTHDMTLAESCDRILHLEHGELA